MRRWVADRLAQWRVPYLGRVVAQCPRCENYEEPNIFWTFWHDLWCWGPRCAWANARLRFTDPDMFRQQEDDYAA